MTDLFGVPLAVGDTIAYTTGGQGNMYIEVGSIKEIDETRNRGFGAALIKTSTGRTATLWRSKHCLIAVAPIKSQHPELFI